MKTGAQDCGRWREAIHLRVCDVLEAEKIARVETHLAGCAECRLYTEEAQAAATGLRWLADRQVEPSPGFRARWTRAVEEAARPSGFGETAAALVVWWRGLLLRNLRPALGMASLWALALLFWLSAPEASPATQTTAARSPVEIARALSAEQGLMAWHVWRWDPLPRAPRPPQPPQPRSERFPAQPAAQSDDLPDAHATVDHVFPNLIALGGSPSLLRLCQT